MPVRVRLWVRLRLRLQAVCREMRVEWATRKAARASWCACWCGCLEGEGGGEGRTLRKVLPSRSIGSAAISALYTSLRYSAWAGMPGSSKA